MLVAMNRFKIAKGFEESFERIWRERDSYLSQVPGFKSFTLLKGTQREDHVLYASHTIWESVSAFEAWVGSEHFRKAHTRSTALNGTYIGHPELELFESVV